MTSPIQLAKMFREMTQVIAKKNGKISVEEMGIELARPQEEYRDELYLLAELSDAEFTKDGELIFKPDFEDKVKQRAPWGVKVWNTAKEWFLRGAKLFFGVGLILSIALAGITILIIIILLMKSKGRGSNREVPSLLTGGGGSGGGGPAGFGAHIFTRLFIRELLWYSLYSNPVPVYHGEDRYIYSGASSSPFNEPPPPPPPHSTTPNNSLPDLAEGGERRSFMTDIFRFLFGDSFDSLADHKLRCLRAIGYFIKAKTSGPVIQAAEVNGYLDEYIFKYHDKEVSNTLSDEYVVHEGYMLPVLRCFKGVTEASPDGEQLYYYFPDFEQEEKDVREAVHTFRESLKQQQAERGNRKHSIPISIEASLESGREEAPILETPKVFYCTKQTIGLGLWNLVQVIVLGWLFYNLDINLLLAEAEITDGIVFSIIALAKYLYWYLFVYAVFYVLFPLLRFIKMKYDNKQINARNLKRIQVCNALVQDDTSNFYSAVSI